jgi:hypothetical protein
MGTPGEGSGALSLDIYTDYVKHTPVAMTIQV